MKKIIDFKNRVYHLVAKIPKGKVSTYKIIANKLNCRAYRAVGNVLNKNKDRNVPCRRVVKSNGDIGGFAFGAKKKIELLKKEGIKIKNKKIQNFSKVLCRF